MTRYGYRLRKASPRVTSFGDTTCDLYLEAFLHEGGYASDWQHLFTISWVNFYQDETWGEWFGFKVELANSMYQCRFDKALKLLNRINKAQMYDSRPDAFVNWLDGRRDVTQVTYDNRTNLHVTAQEVEDNAVCDVWHFFSNGSLITYLYAVAKGHAYEKAIEFDNGRYLNQKETWEFTPRHGEAPKVYTWDEWVQP